MTRLLMLNLNRQGKGTYWRSFGFAKELVKLGYQVTLITINAEGRRLGFREWVVQGVRLVTSPDLHPGSGYDPWDTFQRINWLRGEKFDLIHAFESRPVVIGPALYLQRRDQVPLVVDWCDWFGRGGSVEQRPNPVVRALLRPVETFFEERFRPHAEGHTVINSVLREKALKLDIPPGRILHLPNGANVEEIIPKDKKTTRERLGLPAEAKIVAYTGAIFAADARLMAAAFTRLYRAMPQARLLLVGYNNIRMEEWMGEAQRAVIRTGPVSFQGLADYVAACDVGWLPLRDNGANRGRFPMKLHDFMAAGRPVVATAVGDLGVVVRENGLGSVTVDRPAAFAEAAQALLEDEERQRRIGRHARRVAEAKYAWPVVTQTLNKFYQMVLQS